MTWWVAASAWAGSGPWVVGSDQVTLFLGTEAQRIGHLAVQTAPGERDVIDVAEGVSKFGTKAIGTFGLGNRFDVEATVPWYHVETPRTDHPLCVTLALGACRTTEGVGVLDARIKGLAADEYLGAPLSFALGADVRFGQFTAGTRQRVTNLGEGTFDAGPFAVLGRTGGLGAGYWSGWLEAGYRYRVPNTRSYPQLDGGRAAPGSEFTASTELILSPRSMFGLGPNVTGLWRPFGLDFYEVDLTDPDRFAALRVGNVRVGATAVVRGRSAVFAASFLQTVYGYNNPTDTFVVNLGLQFQGRLAGVGDG